MSEREKIAQRVARVVAALGPDADGFTLIGGSAVALSTDPRVDARPTDDVDLVVHARDEHHRQRNLELLHAAGFREDHTSERALIGAMCLDELLVDVAMTPFPGRNRWYTDLLEHRVHHEGTGAWMAEPLYLLATKLEAYSDRGRRDPLASHDLEDVVSMLLSNPSVLTRLSASEAPVARAVRRQLLQVALGPGGQELFEAHAGHDQASRQAGEEVWLSIHAVAASRRTPLVG